MASCSVQVINYSTFGRIQSYEAASNAIQGAIQHCHDHDTLTPKGNADTIDPAPALAGEKPSDSTNGTSAYETVSRPHDANEDIKDDGGPLAALKKALVSVYGSAQAAYEALSNSEGTVGRKQWKRTIKKTALADHFTGTELKELRSSLPKLTTLSAFCDFVDGSSVQSKSIESDEAPSHLASLPPEVPSLPSSFRARDHAQAQLAAALLESGRRSTSLTAPKSRVSSQG